MHGSERTRVSNGVGNRNRDSGREYNNQLWSDIDSGGNAEVAARRWIQRRCKMQATVAVTAAALAAVLTLVGDNSNSNGDVDSGNDNDSIRDRGLRWWRQWQRLQISFIFIFLIFCHLMPLQTTWNRPPIRSAEVASCHNTSPHHRRCLLVCCCVALHRLLAVYSHGVYFFVSFFVARIAVQNNG